MSKSIQITIFVDATCPFCFVGKRKLEQALAKLPEVTAEIQWLPFQLNPDAPEAGNDYRARMIQVLGSVERFDEAIAGVKAMGAELGLELKPEQIQIMPNTHKALTLIYLSQQGQQQDRVVEGIYDAYYCHGLNVGDPEVLLDIAEQAGFDRQWLAPRLADSTASAEVGRYSEQAKALGITGVPAFIFNNTKLVRGACDSATLEQLIKQLTD